MFDTVHASRFERPMRSGKNRPNLIECEREDGDFVEVVVKGSATTLQGCRDLAVEAICGMLAKDLGLPVPEFFAVELDPDLISNIADEQIRNELSASDRFAFGSRLLPSGFVAWPTNQPVPPDLLQAAAEIFTFDAAVVNGDRRPSNPNCMFSGSQLAIIDHELCFGLELFWTAPWLKGGFLTRSRPDDHIFAKPWLTNCPPNLDRLRRAWDTIDTKRVDGYFSTLPPSWALDQHEHARIRSLALEARTNIDKLIDNSLGALR